MAVVVAVVVDKARANAPVRPCLPSPNHQPPVAGAVATAAAVSVVAVVGVAAASPVVAIAPVVAGGGAQLVGGEPGASEASVWMGVLSKDERSESV